MSMWTMIFLIVLVACATNVLSERYRAMGRLEKRKKQSALDRAVTSERSEQTGELHELRERIKVLERIATDGNSVDARETQRISREIEALRDRQDG